MPLGCNEKAHLALFARTSRWGAVPQQSAHERSERLFS